MIFRLYLFVFLSFFAFPVAAQTSLPPSTDAIGKAVGSTLTAAWSRQQIPIGSQQTIWQNVTAVLSMDATLKENWITLAKELGLIEGTKIGYGGAGASSEYCENYRYLRDAGGNYIVPALSLRGPIAYEYGDEVWFVSHGNMVYNTGDPQGALSIAFWAYNADKIGDKAYAPAYWAPSSTAASPRIVGTRPAHYEGSTLIGMDSYPFSASRNQWAWAPTYAGGPPATWKGGAAVCMGAAADHWQSCADGPSNSNIPTMASVGPAQMVDWVNGSGETGLCDLNMDVIRQIAEKAWCAAAAKPDYVGPPCTLIEPEDVRVVGETPKVSDLNNPAVPAEAPVGDDPTDTPTDEPTDGGSDDPNIPAPSVTPPNATSLVFDWGFPTISLNLGSHNCPTYSADFFGHELTLESHCPFIDQSRAMISAMMILLFTIASAMIVLRA